VLRSDKSLAGHKMMALRAAASFACVFEGRLFELLFQCVLESLLDPKQEIRGASLAEIHRICQVKQRSLKELLESSKDVLMFRLVANLHDSRLLDTVCELLGIRADAFLKENLDTILPQLVHATRGDAI